MLTGHVRKSIQTQPKTTFPGKAAAEPSKYKENLFEPRLCHLPLQVLVGCDAVKVRNIDLVSLHGSHHKVGDLETDAFGSSVC